MSKHIRMLNPIGDTDRSVRNAQEIIACYEPCYVMPCDCAGPGGICYVIIKPIPR